MQTKSFPRDPIPHRNLAVTRPERLTWKRLCRTSTRESATDRYSRWTLTTRPSLPSWSSIRTSKGRSPSATTSARMDSVFPVIRYRFPRSEVSRSMRRSPTSQTLREAARHVPRSRRALPPPATTTGKQALRQETKRWQSHPHTIRRLFIHQRITGITSHHHMTEKSG